MVGGGGRGHGHSGVEGRGTEMRGRRRAPIHDPHARTPMARLRHCRGHGRNRGLYHGPMVAEGLLRHALVRGDSWEAVVVVAAGLAPWCSVLNICLSLHISVFQDPAAGGEVSLLHRLHVASQ